MFYTLSSVSLFGWALVCFVLVLLFIIMRGYAVYSVLGSLRYVKRQTANGKNETFAVFLQLSVQ